MIKSIDIFGKYWITDEKIIDVTADEHARYARAVMLGIALPGRIEVPYEKMFKPLSIAEQSKYEIDGVSNGVIKFLSCAESVDPRIYAMREWGWVRTCKNRFYGWRWDGSKIKTLFARKEFWSKVNPKPTTWIQIIDAADDEVIEGTYESLRLA